MVLIIESHLIYEVEISFTQASLSPTEKHLTFTQHQLRRTGSRETAASGKETEYKQRFHTLMQPPAQSRVLKVQGTVSQLEPAHVVFEVLTDPPF